MTARTLTVALADLALADAEGLNVEVALVSADHTASKTIVASIVTATTNASGIATFQLQPNSTGTQDSRYRVRVHSKRGEVVVDELIQMQDQDATLNSLVSAVAVETPGASAINAAAAATSASEASASAALTEADAAATAADVLLTNADAASTAADVITTNADVVLTNADAASTAADVITTNADAIATAADAVSTAADLALTNADVVETNADVLLTNADAVSTAADVVLAAESEAAAAASWANIEAQVTIPFVQMATSLLNQNERFVAEHGFEE